MNEELARLWPRAERILDDVLDLPEPERSARAVAACGGDPALERAVAELLRADRTSHEFLGGLTATLFAEADPSAEPLPIDRIGPFRIVSELGSGGMGTVLLGERDDGAFEQRVAIKILHRSLATGAARETLVRERRILARLEHPNIARMYDGGVTAAGEPYFVMEYLDGLPLDEACDAGSSPVAERLRLFCRVCRAVEYAHSRFVVHCDLKPRNILLTSSGEVKLVDFGIGHLLEESGGRAAAGVRLLTPAYAAPEQERGEEVTAATDVFQLGLVLYELLTGRRARGENAVPDSDLVLPSRVAATSGAGPDATRIAARRGTSPAALARELEGDLDAVASKALRHDPRDRYESVEALRRDVEAVLGHRPVSARPGTPGYRLRKYVARHRWGVLAASTVAASLVAGIVGITAQSRVAAAERDRARAAETKAAAVNDFVLEELLRAPMPETSLGRALTVNEVLDNAARSVGHAFEDTPQVEAEVRLALARTYAALGHIGDAAAQARAARTLLDRTPAVGEVPRQEAERTLAEISIDEGRYADARTALDELRRRQLVSPGPADPESLRTAAALGRALVGLRDYARAEPLLRDARARAQREHPEAWRLLLDLERPLAQALYQQSEAAEAERLTRTMLARIEDHVGPDHPERVAALTLLANTLVAQLRYPDALETVDQAIDLSRRVFGTEHPATAEALNLRALVLDRLGNDAEALAALNEGLGIERRTLGPDHPRTTQLLFNLALLQRNAGDLDGADAALREVVEARSRALGEAHADTIAALRARTKLLLLRNRQADARASAARTMRAFEAATAPPDADFGLVSDFADFLLEIEPADLQDPDRALALAERAATASGRRNYPALRTLADALERAGRADDAIATLREVLELPDGMRSWSTEEKVVKLLGRTGTPRDVEAFLDERLATQRARPGADERMIAKTLRLLGRHLREQDRLADSERAFREALDILRRVVPADNWEIGRVSSELGACLAARGDEAEAEELLVEGCRILDADPLSSRLAKEAHARLEEFRAARGGPADPGR